MTKPITLVDLCPEDASFTLSDGRCYAVRRFTLNDQAWVQRTFGSDGALAEAFKDPESLIRIVFHQLPLEQQKQFAPQTVERVDEDTGEVLTEQVGGWRAFAASITNASHDLTEIAKALTAAMVGSAALADEQAPKEAKKKPVKLTGAQSSTSSHPSTVTATAP